MKLVTVSSFCTCTLISVLMPLVLFVISLVFSALRPLRRWKTHMIGVWLFMKESLNLKMAFVCLAVCASLERTLTLVISDVAKSTLMSLSFTVRSVALTEHPKPFVQPCSYGSSLSWILWMQKLMSPLLRTRIYQRVSLLSFYCKSEYFLACLPCGLPEITPIWIFPVHSTSFVSKPIPLFTFGNCMDTRFPVWVPAVEYCGCRNERPVC